MSERVTPSQQVSLPDSPLRAMSDLNSSSWGDSTTAVHNCEPEKWPYKPLIQPLVMSTSYKYESPSKRPEIAYERQGNPTRNCLQDTISSLEGAQYTLCFASGMTAMVACAQLLKPGDHVICSSEVFGGTTLYFAEYAADKSFTVTYVDAVKDPENVRKALQRNTKMVWVEIYSNPMLGVLDIDAVAKIVSDHSKDTLLIVDNTFLTPYIIKPLSHGATIVMHSLTKFMSGHGDLIMGSLSTNRKDLHYTLSNHSRNLGMMAPPFECFLVSRSLKTLSIRMRQHSSNAMSVAQFLESHPKVEKVLYPGLPSHPHHARAKKLMGIFGGMVTFYLKGDLDCVNRFMSALRVFTSAISLGATESLVCCPWALVTSFQMLPKETLVSMEVTENMIRLSAGLEDIEDLIEDLKQALDKASSE